MRKMFTLLITLFVIYFGFEFCFNFFGKGHDVNYIVKTSEGDINVHEVLTINNKNEQNNYFININVNDKNIPFKIYQSYYRKSKVIKNVYAFEGENYTCVKIEVESDKNPSNIKCVNNTTNIAYNYNEIYGKDANLDEIVSKSGYEINKYISIETDQINKDNISVYPHNFMDKQNLLIGLYKGPYLFGKKITSSIHSIELFDQDAYEKNIEAVVGKYYLVANYNLNHEFNEIFLINIVNGTKSKIKSNYNISFDSLVQGVVGNDLYLLDNNAKKQYKVDTKNSRVEVVGNEDKGVQIYSDGEWKTQNINYAINNKILFEDKKYNEVNGETYDKVILNGDENNGTYYCFKKNGDSFDVYSVYTMSDIKTYLFTTTDITRIVMKNGYVYYLDDNNLMVYAPDFGKKKLITYNELKFNSNLNYYVY